MKTIKNILSLLLIITFVSCDNEAVDPTLTPSPPPTTNGGNGGGNNGGGNTTTVVGSYKLTAFNSSVPTDLNNDGTSSTNQLSETSCFNNTFIIINSNNTFNASFNQSSGYAAVYGPQYSDGIKFRNNTYNVNSSVGGSISHYGFADYHSGSGATDSVENNIQNFNLTSASCYVYQNYMKPRQWLSTLCTFQERQSTEPIIVKGDSLGKIGVQSDCLSNRVPRKKPYLETRKRVLSTKLFLQKTSFSSRSVR